MCFSKQARNYGSPLLPIKKNLQKLQLSLNLNLKKKKKKERKGKKMVTVKKRLASPNFDFFSHNYDLDKN